mmetsp:Transcript_1343/g.2331  ORF Transcript_1343/g.2331 Transcript_1343/m.2331 type:complete len:166 (-) Transcript_1343:32-529(-)
MLATRIFGETFFIFLHLGTFTAETGWIWSNADLGRFKRCRDGMETCLMTVVLSSSRACITARDPCSDAALTLGRSAPPTSSGTSDAEFELLQLHGRFGDPGPWSSESFQAARQRVVCTFNFLSSTWQWMTGMLCPNDILFGGVGLLLVLGRGSSIISGGRRHSIA